jgi:hypothetical protein
MQAFLDPNLHLDLRVLLHLRDRVLHDKLLINGLVLIALLDGRADEVP